MFIKEEPLPKFWIGVLFPKDGVPPHSNHVEAGELLGLTAPFNVAIVSLIEVAESVETLGAEPGWLKRVVKLKIEPCVVPEEFWATIRKKYVVFWFKFTRSKLRALKALPVPTCWTAVEFPSEELAPHSNHADV